MKVDVVPLCWILGTFLWAPLVQSIASELASERSATTC